MQNLKNYRPTPAQLRYVGIILFVYIAGYLTPDIRHMQLGARATPTPKATATTRATRTPRMTLTATLTPVPVTVTPTPTGTPLPNATPTSTPFAHDVTLWHEPGIAGHQHGQNPLEVHPEIVAWLNTHPIGKYFSSIGHPWASSTIENLYPWPLGKHEGHVFLSENETNCPQFDPGGQFQHGNCVDAYLFQPHVLGNMQEFLARVHSDKVVAWVCDKATGLQCGIVATGGLADYGMGHDSYKKLICPLESNPPFGESSIFQPPYRTVNGSNRFFLFWSSLANASVAQYFDPDPNRILQTAWNNRPFSVPQTGDLDRDGVMENPDACQDADLAIHHDNEGNRNNVFQVFTLLLYIEDFPRPFDGYTDVHGVLSTTCTAPSAVCVPLYIGANVPVGNATLNRPVVHGDPEAAPIQIYGADVELLPPGTMP